jgi:hypothetical protein
MSDFIKPRIRSGDNHYQAHTLCQVGSLGVDFSFSGLTDGIVQLIEQFGSRLYYGFPHKNIFLYHWYSHKRHQLIQYLNQYDPTDTDHIDSDNIKLYLHMARVAQSQQWKYPSFVTRMPDGSINQTTGGTRAFAIGLTKPNPWKHFPILMLEHADKDINLILDNPVHITTDRQLTEILGGTYDKDIWDPTIRLRIEINKIHPTGGSYCLLKHVDDFNYNGDNIHYGQKYLKKFHEWRLKNPYRPKLKIYTNYPNRIKDINGVWDWEIAGETGNFESLMGEKVGWVENMVRQYHNNVRTHNDEYVVWLIKDRTVDLGDLLPWMECDHTTFITNDYALACYRSDTTFKTTFVDVSYQE